MLSTVAEIIRDLLIFVGVIAALLIGLILVVARSYQTANPLKRLLTALCYRLGATLAAGAGKAFRSRRRRSFYASVASAVHQLFRLPLSGAGRVQVRHSRRYPCYERFEIGFAAVARVR